jgi:SAM-dependent methyltransferase
MSSSPTPDFGRLAATYDELRPADEHWLEVVQLLVGEASLAGARVLDVGCGTGRLAVELASRGSDVSGVEPSPEMLGVARRVVPRNVRLARGSAERLPFPDGAFERVVYQLVVHLIDRPRSFAEARRVLVPGGLAAVVSFEERHFDRYFLNGFFPSLAAIDRARFPTREALAGELADAGFEPPRFVSLHQEMTLARPEVLRRIAGRHISTFDLLDQAELAEGLARARAGLPDEVSSTRDFLLAVARRG